MRTRRSWAVLAIAALLTVVASWMLLPTTRSSAQVQDGATMTVLRGQVAVVHSDGTAVQPAPTGTVVSAGDEIRTLGSTSALITFFSGTEIELEQNTTIAIDHVSQQGGRVDISLKQAFGTTVNRVQSLTGTGSTYRIDAGGAVALVRGTTFVVVGPITTAAGNIVIIVCGADCSAASTFVGCPLAPYMGYGVQVSNGQVESPCIPFAVPRNQDLTSVAYEAVTTIEQTLQGDTHGTPAGQVQSGQRQEIAAQGRRRKDDDDPPKEAPPTSTPATSSAPSGTLSVSINDVSTTEGSNATFTVTLSGVSSQPVSVSYATSNGTAVAPGDFTATSGTLTIPAGSTTGTISVPTISDTAAPTAIRASAVEPPETFTVSLTGAIGATIGDAQGTGTIVDPVGLTLSINDASATEGASASFTVTLSALSSQPVTVNYTTADGTAGAPGDYTTTSGTLTIPVGSTTATITVPTATDAIVEPAETFVVNLSGATVATIADTQGTGTIVDNDTATVSINDVTVSEATGTASFTVTLSLVSSQAVNVSFATANGSAIAPNDYTAASSSVTIPAGSTTAPISIAIVNDDLDEVNNSETFVVNLTGSSGPAITDAQGTGTIQDDDVASLSIGDVSQNEGNDCTPVFSIPPIFGPCGTTAFNFTVTLSKASEQAISVEYRTSSAGGTATGGTSSACQFTSSDGGIDYVTIDPTTLNFAAGSAGTQSVTVQVCADESYGYNSWAFGDFSREPNETFFVILDNATGGAVIGDPSGEGTIVDDDTEFDFGV